MDCGFWSSAGYARNSLFGALSVGLLSKISLLFPHMVMVRSWFASSTCRFYTLGTRYACSGSMSQYLGGYEREFSPAEKVVVATCMVH
jgi:hypothetical protein